MSGMTFLRHNQHVAGSELQELIGDTAKYGSPHPSIASRSHHEQIRLVLADCPQDRRQRIALADDQLIATWIRAFLCQQVADGRTGCSWRAVRVKSDCCRVHA